MISTKQKQEIQEALSFYQEEIVSTGNYERFNYIQLESMENEIKERAKEELVDVDNLEGFELLDINLDDPELVEQEKEIVNYIEEL